MRAITLAAVVLSVLALSATHPTLAADRTVQTEAGDSERAPVFEWLGVWLEIALQGLEDPVTLTRALLPAEEETPAKGPEDLLKDSDGNGVILEDGAPF